MPSHKGNHCRSSDMIRNGKANGKQRYLCKRCGKRTTNLNHLHGMRFESSLIKFCAEVYASTGVSIRELSRILERWRNINVSHQAIANWINKFSDSLKSLTELETSDTWHAGETAVNVKGETCWLWIILDRQSRTVISWQLSPTREMENAGSFLRRAKEKASNKPSRIITDRYRGYPRAFRSVFDPRQIKHVPSSLHRMNARIERLMKIVKKRLKWFPCFHSLKSAENFFSLFLNHYNGIKLYGAVDTAPLNLSNEIQSTLFDFPNPPPSLT